MFILHLIVTIPYSISTEIENQRWIHYDVAVKHFLLNEC